MISRYEKTILNILLDKYERSKSFTQSNKVNQRFCVNVAALFPQYTDHADFETFQAVNDTIDVLIRKKLISAQRSKAKVYSEICLNLEEVSQVYTYLGRVHKKDINASVVDLLEESRDKNEILKKFRDVQVERIRLNKSIEYFNHDLVEFGNILRAVEELFKVDSETFARDFSVRLFRDSKMFDRIRSKVINLLFEYGDFPEKNQVLESLNIIDNPTYVNFKGAGVITIARQRIDLGRLKSDIAISSALLEEVEHIEITGNKVVTIENLTSFNTAKDSEAFLIYLGGFHNRIRRNFIKKIYTQNPNVEFKHFGDIDAGSFYILEHLRKSTGIHFAPYRMDLNTLIQYENYTKRLTDIDQIRLQHLLGLGYDEVITYMLEHNCKLEQEAIQY